MKNLITPQNLSVYNLGKKLIFYLVLHTLIFDPIGFLTVNAQSDGLPRGAYEMPYYRYESESGDYGGGAVFYHNPEFNENLIAAEASDQKYVGLPSNDAYVQWQINHQANGVTLRFTMPDGSNGEGEQGSIDIYVNDILVKNLGLTSYWAWQYFPGSEPENHPGNRPRMRFDEIHFLLETPLSPGDTFRLQKNNGDAFEYGIDFIEIEKVPEPIQKPTGYISVTDYGAFPNDTIDDLPAFHAALSAAGSAGTGIYIPAGKFTLANKLVLKENNIGILGAGIWHTELFFSTEDIFSGGILARSSNVEISNFYMNTINNQRFLNGQYVIYKGFMGTYGVNSSIHDVWVTHFETGAWIAGYDAPYPIDVTQNLKFTNNRIRNNYADGINLCQGTSNTIVSHNNFRSNGDDAMAVWPDSSVSAPVAVNNIFKYNTIENTYRAAGAAIFGGNGHEVHHCIIKDNHAGSGIRLTTDFPGYHFENTSHIKFYENTIEACGTSNDLWGFERGAIEINATNHPIQNVFFENIDIINAQRHGIQIGSTQSLDLQFDNITINGTGLDPFTSSLYTIPTEGAAIMVFAQQGTAIFKNLIIENIERQPPIFKSNETFNLILENNDIPLAGISLSENEIEMMTGENYSISVNFHPSNASNKRISWKSSNSNIATYNEIEKKIVAHNTGTATLTAIAEDGGFTANITINVSENDGSDIQIYRIKNSWNNTYLTDSQDQVTYNTSAIDETYNWILEPLEEGGVEIKNVVTHEYLNIEKLTGYLECTPRVFGWQSSRWVIEEAGNGKNRIRSAWQTSQYLHIENLLGSVQYGTIYDSWASAKWELEEVTNNKTHHPKKINKDKVTVYPNPTKDTFTLEYTGNIEKNASFAIYSTTGALIKKEHIYSPVTKIPTNELKTGVYFIKTHFDSYSENIMLLVE